jgi:large subunit ribosomal protein L35
MHRTGEEIRMPKKYKLKTHKGAQKRFGITATGKITRTKGLKSHLRRNKAKRDQRIFDKKLILSSADEAKVKRLLPYGV